MIYGDTFLSTVSLVTCGLWSSDSPMAAAVVVVVVVVVMVVVAVAAVIQKS
jgi:hypothetical protein